MTTIAFDGTMLAADSKFSKESDEYGGYSVGNQSKIWLCRNNAIATAGTTKDAYKFQEWFAAGADLAKYPKLEISFTAIKLSRNGVLYEYFSGTGKTGHPLRTEYYPTAMGGGELICRGALGAKKNAHHAIQITAGIHDGTGLPVYSITPAQLKALPHDFVGLWIGTHEAHVKDLKRFLVAEVRE